VRAGRQCKRPERQTISTRPTMSNLITLACPSCGAILDDVSGNGRFSCKYCGSTHILADTPPGMDTNGVICPLGQHQDLVLKVSTVVKSQVFDATQAGTDAPARYASELAQKLLCPPRPGFSLAGLATREGILALVLMIVLFFAILGSVLLSYLFPMGNVCGFLLFFAVGAYAAIPIAKNTLLPVLQKKNLEFRERLKRWEITRNRWEHSYYCQKHDIVFLKGGQQTVAPEAFSSFLPGRDGDAK